MSQALTLNEELEKFYSTKFYFSYSSISKILLSPRLFYNHYVLNEKEDSTGPHLVAGKALHCLLFEPEKFDDYFIMIPGKIPTDSNKIILDHIFMTKYLPMQNTSLSLEDFSQDILNQLLNNNLYQNLTDDKKDPSITGDSKRLEKILTDNNKEYFEFLKLKELKTVIDKTVKEKADEGVEVLKANKAVRALLQLDKDENSNVKVFSELKLQYDSEQYDFGYKGILDNVVVDEEAKRIFINDLKTTNKSIQDFPNSVEYYRYDIQASIYRLLVINNFIKNKEDADDWEILITFIVIDKYNQVYPYQVSDETLVDWESNFYDIVKQVDYHYRHRDYTLPYQLALGNVKL